jgi:hypothetical protein
MTNIAATRNAHRAADLRARRLVTQRRAEEAATLVRFERTIRFVMLEEAVADQLEGHRRRVAAWRQLEAVRAEAARTGLVDEVEHLIRATQRGRATGPAFRTHGDVLRRWG